MPYTPTTWVDNVTQTLAATMNNIEEGISANDAALAGKATTTALTSETNRAAAAEGVASQALRTSAVRDGAFAPDPATGLGVFTSSAGLTYATGYLAATVAGTDGTGIVSRWAGVSRASFRVRCTKATASSKSYVGLANNAQSATPLTTTPTFGVGYKAGSGLAIIRENVGADIVLVADTSITDGDLYDVSIIFDTALSPTSADATKVTRLGIRWAKSDGTSPNQTSADINQAYWSTLGNIFARTNVAAGGIASLSVTAPVIGANALVGGGALRYGPTTGDDVLVRLPAKPNGLAVLACHGYGGNYLQTGWTSPVISPTWAALEAAGYTILVPSMGGDLWGNNTAQGLLATLWGHAVNDLKLDPRVFLWGNSMGGGAALTAIARRAFPVRAAYLTGSPVADLAWAAGSGLFPNIATVYPTVAERDANDPMKLPVGAFAGVPLLFVASTSDTSVSKTANTDAMRARLGATVPNYLISATGNHQDPSMFRPTDTLDWFASNI